GVHAMCQPLVGVARCLRCDAVFEKSQPSMEDLCSVCQLQWSECRRCLGIYVPDPTLFPSGMCPACVEADVQAQADTCEPGDGKGGFHWESCPTRELTAEGMCSQCGDTGFRRTVGDPHEDVEACTCQVGRAWLNPEGERDTTPEVCGECGS